MIWQHKHFWPCTSLDVILLIFCLDILSLENRPPNGGFRVNESGWFCTTLDSTLFRVNNSRWTRSSHPFCAYLHLINLEFVQQMVILLKNNKASFSTWLYLEIVPNDHKSCWFDSKMWNWAFWAPRIYSELCNKLSECAEMCKWSPTSHTLYSAEM